jgi:hypothetical protein
LPRAGQYWAAVDTPIVPGVLAQTALLAQLHAVITTSAFPNLTRSANGCRAGLPGNGSDLLRVTPPLPDRHLDRPGRRPGRDESMYDEHRGPRRAAQAWPHGPLASRAGNAMADQTARNCQA